MSKILNERQIIEGLVKYFQNLKDDKEQQELNRVFEWYLGLRIAKRILYIYDSTPNDLSELELLVKILENGATNFGSGWLDLYIHANGLFSRLSDKML